MLHDKPRSQPTLARECKGESETGLASSMMCFSLCRYLEASVLALDVTNDITKNHMTQVLQTLTGQLSNAEQSHRSNPNSASLMRLIKRLRMITERLCHSPES